MVEKKVKIGEVDPLVVLGYNDSLLHYVESRFDSTITIRNNVITIRGSESDVTDVESVFGEMLYVAKKKGALDMSTVSEIVALVAQKPPKKSDEKSSEKETSGDNVILWGRKEPIRAKTPRQIEYLQKMRTSDLVFAIGPAGTGKTTWRSPWRSRHFGITKWRRSFSPDLQSKPVNRWATSPVISSIRSIRTYVRYSMPWRTC